MRVKLFTYPKKCEIWLHKMALRLTSLKAIVHINACAIHSMTPNIYYSATIGCEIV